VAGLRPPMALVKQKAFMVIMAKITTKMYEKTYAKWCITNQIASRWVYISARMTPKSASTSHELVNLCIVFEVKMDRIP
jgi:hypothetical protein